MLKLRNFIIVVFSLMIIASGIMMGCGKQGEKKLIVVGAKNFTEQYVLGNIFSLLLQKNGFEVTEKFGLGTKVLRNGLTTGQMDIYPEYTGTGWAVHLQHKDNAPNNPDILYQKVKNEDYEKNNIVWLDRFSFNNTYALALKGSRIYKTGDTLSEYAKYFNRTRKDIMAVGHEFYERPDGFFKMAEVYGMKVPKSNVKTMDIGLGYDAIAKDQVDVIMIFSTDGMLVKHKLHVLEDDKFFFPIYNVCPTLRKEIYENYPEIENILKPLASLLDRDTMQILNAKVDVERLPASKVAEDFLKKNNLL
jgi:osmoprotectant transport system substrate-binding protein